MTFEGRGIIRFAEKIVQLLDEGGFSATYKYAVLLGLTDLCLERSAVDGSPPTSITTPQLAAKIVELYWPHAEPFDDTGVVLRQNSGSQARIVSLIERFAARMIRARRCTGYARRLPEPSASSCARSSGSSSRCRCPSCSASAARSTTSST